MLNRNLPQPQIRPYTQNFCITLKQLWAQQNLPIILKTG
jgi:hypothetical protein